MDNFRKNLSSAQKDHQAALESLAVVEAQKQNLLQDIQEQVSQNFKIFNHIEGNIFWWKLTRLLTGSTNIITIYNISFDGKSVMSFFSI